MQQPPMHRPATTSQHRLHGRLSHPWCGSVRRRHCGRQHVQVTRTAVEPDMGVASTSGRPHSSSLHNGVHVASCFPPDLRVAGDDTLTLSAADVVPPHVEGHPHSSSSHPADQDLVRHQQQQQQQQLEGGTAEEEELDEAAQLRAHINARLKAASTLPSLLEAIRADVHHFDGINLSFALYRLTLLHNAFFKQLHVAQLTSREAQAAAYNEYVQPALSLLEAQLVLQAGSFNVWEVSLCLWALGNLNQAGEALLRPLCARGIFLLPEFQAIDCAAALGGLAKLPVRPRCAREFVDHLLHHTLESLNHAVPWRPRELAQVSWALSRLGAGRSSHKRVLLETLMDMVLVHLEDFTMQELSIIVYSYGRLRYRIPRALDALAGRLGAHMHLLNSQDAANLMWAFPQLRHPPPAAFLNRLPLVMVERLSEFKPQEVCNLVYGYARLHHRSPHLLDGVAKACAPRLHEFSTQDLVLTLWSYGQLEYQPADGGVLFQTACAVLLDRQASLHPAQVTIAMKGFARAAYAPSDAFMATMAQLAMDQLKLFRPIEFSQLLWSYAALGYRDVALFEAVVAHAVQLLQTWQQPLNKTTVDTVVWCCQRVGYWPQALIDIAEVRGIYVRTNYQHLDEEEQQLLPTPHHLQANLPQQQQQQQPKAAAHQQRHQQRRLMQQAPAASTVEVPAGVDVNGMPLVRLPVQAPPPPPLAAPQPRKAPAIINLLGQHWQAQEQQQQQQQQAVAAAGDAAGDNQQQQQQWVPPSGGAVPTGVAEYSSNGVASHPQQQQEQQQSEGQGLPHLYHTSASALPLELTSEAEGSLGGVDLLVGTPTTPSSGSSSSSSSSGAMQSPAKRSR